jgi:AcrR family transcriptional regulator
MKKRAYRMTGRAESALATRTRILACAEKFASTNLFDSTTLEAIAACAETTVRTVLRSFGSKEQLFAMALDNIGFSMIGPVNPGDSEAVVKVLYDFYEKHGDMVIRWLADELRIAAISDHLRTGRRNLRGWVEDAFAPSLSRMDAPARKETLNALIVALDVYTWKLLRRDFGLSPKSAQAVVRRILAGSIASELDLE